MKVRAKLNLHGIFQIEGAQLVEEEEYEEKVKEKRELPAEEAQEEEFRKDFARQREKRKVFEAAQRAIWEKEKACLQEVRAPLVRGGLSAAA